MGDSRVYRFQKDILTQVSVDHSKVQRLVAMDILTPEEARKDPERRKINQYLGMPKDIRMSPYIEPTEKLKKGDIYLLCSDGLTDMVEDSQIKSVIASSKDVKEIAGRLVKAALKNGGRDNVTVMVLKILEVSEENGSGQPRGGKLLRPVLTGAQVVVGGGLLLTTADLIYYLTHM